MAVALAFVALRVEARAEPPCWRWLPGETRAVPLADTASRDAPVLEYAFGPTGQVSLGHALGLVSRTGGAVGTHLQLTGLVALEDASGAALFPDELARVRATTSIAWSWDRAMARALGPGATLELGLELGLERSRELVAAESDRVDLRIEGDDIPFGGGGVWVGLDLSLRAPLGGAWTLEARLADRMFTNAFPLLFGLRAESNVAASFMGEGLSHAPSLALGLRWAATPSVQPVARVFVEGLFARDDNADSSYFARLMVGSAFPGRAGELLPFVSLDVGAGKGLLVNRHELRLSIGVRHAFR
ncbi:MAG: hypothetical protein U1F43_39360 [Myxococcota bacterium]